MSFAILIDMNLSPHWVGWFEDHGWPALHWSAVGDPRATDREILAWARENHRVLFTHDLDVGAVLASSSANSPSVIQLRAKDVTPAAAGGLILGALVSLENDFARAPWSRSTKMVDRCRILPLRTSDAR